MLQWMGQLPAKEKVKEVGFSNKPWVKTELPTEVSNGGVSNAWLAAAAQEPAKGRGGFACKPYELEGDQRK